MKKATNPHAVLTLLGKLGPLSNREIDAELHLDCAELLQHMSHERLLHSAAPSDGNPADSAIVYSIPAADLR